MYIFRVDQQRLIKFPQNYPRYQTNDQSPDTQKILNEIQRINLEFGYVKKEPQITPRIDLESYFYPRPAYHPIHQRHNNGMALPPTIRQLNTEDKTSQYRSELYPFNVQTYYYPTPYLQVPIVETAQLFQRPDSSRSIQMTELTESSGENDLFGYSPQYDPYRMHGKVMRDYNQEKALIQAVKKIVNEIKQNNKSQQLDTAVIINKIEGESRTSHKNQHRSQPSTLSNKDETRTVDDSVVINANNTKEKIETATPISTTIHSKTFFSRPKPTKTPSSSANLKSTESPQIIVKFDTPPSDNAPPPSIKGPFSFLTGSQKEPPAEVPPPPPAVKGVISNFLTGQKEQVIEALRQGGIIIQRLRVREGGIAIAGPGGVATAGSGGTAIVGPGGIALTHPRSLAIAGPGAKVIAVPEDVDLERLALRANARNLPIEGVVVATGPVIYYNPAPTT